MNAHTQPGGSLLERADAAFDFRRAMRTMPVAAPVVVEAAPEAGPVLELDTIAPEPLAPKAYAPAPRIGRTVTIDRAALASAQLIVPGAAPGVLGEEFRIAKRALLAEAKRSDRARAILVASAQPGEGKTWVALNLALSIAAEPDVEVLLVDGDVLKPKILSRLGVEAAAGLMDALADASLDVERLVLATDIARLSLLPAGRRIHGDAEALASTHTRAVFEGLLAANPRRILVIDSPPALSASHASVLALHAGQAVMVVKADATGEADLRDALALLGGCATIQLLLNRVRYAAGGRRFGTYYPEGDRDAS